MTSTATFERQAELTRLHTQAGRLEADGLCAKHLDEQIAKLEREASVAKFQHLHEVSDNR